MQTITITFETLRAVNESNPVRNHFYYKGVWYRVAASLSEGDEAPELTDPQAHVLLCACTSEEVAMLAASFGEVMSAIEQVSH